MGRVEKPVRRSSCCGCSPRGEVSRVDRVALQWSKEWGGGRPHYLDCREYGRRVDVTESQGTELLVAVHDLQERLQGLGYGSALHYHMLGALLMALMVIVFFLIWRSRG